MKRQSHIRLIVSVLIFSWIFFGWPRIFNFPPEIQEVKAATTQGVVVYGEGTQTAPRNTPWNGTGWDAEATNTDLGLGWGITGARVAAATTRTERIAIFHDFTNKREIEVQRWNNGSCSSWCNEWETATGGTVEFEAFAVAYEQSSGDAIVVYGDGTDTKYRTWNGTSWSGELTLSSSILAQWVKLAPKEGSDEIMAAVIDVNGIVHGFRWTASAWGNQVDGTGVARIDFRGMDVAWETNSGDAILVWGDETANVLYRQWHAGTSSWDASDQTAFSLSVNWLRLATDPRSTKNNIALILSTAGSTIERDIWTGSSWISRPTAISSADPTYEWIGVAWGKEERPSLPKRIKEVLSLAEKLSVDP